MSASSNKVRRFYETVEVTDGEGGCRIVLDGKPVKAPSGRALSMTRAVAEAVAAEWRTQGDTIDRSSMPMTAIVMAGAADDEVLGQWRGDILAYLGTDLLCYRADGPDALVARQAAAWDPLIDWVEREYGARMTVASGVVAVTQPPALSEAVKVGLDQLDGATLYALRSVTAITGSAALAVALWRGDFDGDAIFEASRIDERFQQEKWGVDAEAAAREASIKSEFDALVRFLTLARDE